MVQYLFFSHVTLLKITSPQNFIECLRRKGGNLPTARTSGPTWQRWTAWSWRSHWHHSASSCKSKRKVEIKSFKDSRTNCNYSFNLLKGPSLPMGYISCRLFGSSCGPKGSEVVNIVHLSRDY